MKPLIYFTEKSSTSSLVSGRISSLIHDAESKTKRKSNENLNLIRRESPVGSEFFENKSKSVATKSAKNTEKSPNNIETSSAPKLPPKPGRRSLFSS